MSRWLLILIVLSACGREPIPRDLYNASIVVPSPTIAPTATVEQVPVVIEVLTTEQPTANPTPDVRIRQTEAALFGTRILIEADYGDAWPFTIPEIEVFCLPGRKLVMDTGTRWYGLNGTADYPLFPADMWRDDPSLPGAKINVGPILAVAETTCV